MLLQHYACAQNDADRLYLSSDIVDLLCRLNKFMHDVPQVGKEMECGLALKGKDLDLFSTTH
jgi:hypothetical protein